MCARLLRLAAAARQRLAGVPGAGVLDGPGVDPTKLVVLLAGTGAHGHAVEADLIAAGMPVEMADRDTIIPILTIADDETAADRFTEVLVAAIERHRGAPRRPVAPARLDGDAADGAPPARGFFRARGNGRGRCRHRADQRRAGGSLPARRPGARAGRVITAEALAALRAAHAEGGRIAYAADPTAGHVPGHHRRQLTAARRSGSPVARYLPHSSTVSDIGYC